MSAPTRGIFVAKMFTNTNQTVRGEDSLDNKRRFLLGLRRFERQATWFTVILTIIVSLYPNYSIAQSVETGGSTTLSMTEPAPIRQGASI